MSVAYINLLLLASATDMHQARRVAVPSVPFGVDAFAAGKDGFKYHLMLQGILRSTNQATSKSQYHV